jgi:regulatory protein
VWHEYGVNRPIDQIVATVRRSPHPLDAARLDELALAYVARFATSTGKLAAYLARKLRERGWDEDAAEPPDVEAVVERMARAGYVSDEGYARMRSASLRRRGLAQGGSPRIWGRRESMQTCARRRSVRSRTRALPRLRWPASGVWGLSARAMTMPGRGSTRRSAKSRLRFFCGPGTPCHGARARECSECFRGGRVGL